MGLALRSRSGASSVIGWDADPGAAASAIQRGALDVIAPSTREAVADAEIVVLAPPTESVIPLLESISDFVPNSAAVTDVGSAKGRIVEAGEQFFGGRFVGGHPMAGLEASGIAYADSHLFEGAAWLLTPTPRTDEGVLKSIRALVATTGATPRVCDPQEHDRLVAFISHLPHVLAYGLADSAGRAVPDEWVDSIAGSFRDGTRVALSDPERWSEILMQNRPATVHALETFLQWTEGTLEALKSEERAQLKARLQDAHLARRRFPR